MKAITTADTYKTTQRKVSFIGRHFPSILFYWRVIWSILVGYRLARKGAYDLEAWYQTSRATIAGLEEVGIHIELDNLSVLTRMQKPCVFIGNHMSTMETFMLPSIVLPFAKITFVVKQSLVERPIFKDLMISCNPIVVGRTNPREDLKTMLTEGEEHLKRGTSVVVFPQTTRSEHFDPAQFNSIGIKLAKRAGVSVVPIALKTDAWGNGKRFKDFGKIDPAKKAYMCFGEPLTITGNGKDEHAAIIKFICDKLQEWS